MHRNTMFATSTAMNALSAKIVTPQQSQVSILKLVILNTQAFSACVMARRCLTRKYAQSIELQEYACTK